MYLYKVYQQKKQGFTYCCQMRGSSAREIWGRLRDSGMEGTYFWGTTNAWNRYVNTGVMKGIYKATFVR